MSVEFYFIFFAFGFAFFSALIGVLFYERIRSGRKEFSLLGGLFASLASFNILYFLQQLGTYSTDILLIFDLCRIAFLYFVLFSLVKLASNIDFLSEKLAIFVGWSSILPLLGFVIWLLSGFLQLYISSVVFIMAALISYLLYLIFFLSSIKDKSLYEKLLFRFLLVGLVYVCLISISLLAGLFWVSESISISALHIVIYLQGGISIPIIFYLRDINLTSNGRERKSIDGSILNKYSITAREYQVIELLFEGATYREIADKLCISHDTVKSHLYSTYRKANVKSRQELRTKLL